MKLNIDGSLEMSIAEAYVLACIGKELVINDGRIWDIVGSKRDDREGRRHDYT